MLLMILPFRPPFRPAVSGPLVCQFCESDFLTEEDLQLCHQPAGEMHLLEAPTSRCSIVGRASFAKGRAASLHELAEPPNTHAGKLRRRSAKGRLRTRLRSKTRRGIYQRRLGKTAAPFRRGPCRKLAAGLGPAARPGTATSTSTRLSSMHWNHRAHLSSKFDVLPMLEHERVADDKLDGGHPSMCSMVPDATASTANTRNVLYILLFH